MDSSTTTPVTGRSITFPTDRNEALVVQLLGREFDVEGPERECTCDTRQNLLDARPAALQILDQTAECSRPEDWTARKPWGHELYNCLFEQHRQLDVVLIGTDTMPPDGHIQDTVDVAKAITRWCELQPAYDRERHRIKTIIFRAKNATAPTVGELATFEDECRTAVQERLRRLVVERGAAYFLFDRSVPALRPRFETMWKERIVPNGVPIYAVQQPHSWKDNFEPPTMEPRERTIRLEDETRRAYASVAADYDHHALADQILKVLR